MLRIDADIKSRLEILAERERRSLTKHVEGVLEAGLGVVDALMRQQGTGMSRGMLVARTRKPNDFSCLWRSLRESNPSFQIENLTS